MSATNLSTLEVYLEDTPLNLADIVITDGGTATATLTLSNAAAGALSTGTSGVVTSTYDSATGIWSASGAIADVNALLAAVTFTPAENFNGNFDIATSVSDETGTFTGDKPIFGTAVNDAPVAVDDSYTTTEDTALTVAAPGILGNDTDVDGDALTASVVNAPANGTVTLTVATGSFTYTPDANFNGTDSFTYQANDGTANSNVATVTLTVTAEADLSVLKTVNNPTPNVGDQITFTVTLSDLGPSTATGVQLTDLLPAGLTFVSATTSQGTYSFSTGSWDVGTVSPGAPQTLSITATVVSPDAQTNTGTIGAADQFDPDTGNNTDSATETPQQADLFVSKTVSNATPNVGDTITFTVTLSNGGPEDATNVAVTDLLPAGLTGVAATVTQGTYSFGTGFWDVGTVISGALQTLNITAMVVSPAAQTNTGSISAADQFDPITANNAASATETPQQADLFVSKTVSNATPNVGDTITFTVTLSNQGPDAATNVQLTDQLPAGLTFVGATTTQGTYSGGSGFWDVGTVISGALQTLNITAMVVSPAAQTNTGSISAADQFDPITANNAASVTETPQQADLSVLKSVNNPTPNVGETIAFTVTLSDQGPDAATNVVVTDLLPAGLIFAGATATQGTYVSGSGVWTVGTVSPGGPQTLSIFAVVDIPGAQTNTAAIGHADQFDPDTANNSASVTETPQVPGTADLAITKTDGVLAAVPGTADTYTITVSNNGPSAVTGASVSDPLPAGTNAASWMATGFTGGGSVSVGAPTNGIGALATTVDLPVNATVTFTFTTAINPSVIGSFMNTATVAPPAGTTDPNPTNNSVTDTDTLTPAADLSIINSDGVTNFVPGGITTYNIVVSNAGPSTAVNSTVTDLFSAAFTAVSWTAAATPGSSVAQASGTGNIFNTVTLLPGGTAIFTAVAQINPSATGALTNTATVTSPPGLDTNTGNNSATDVDTLPTGLATAFPLPTLQLSAFGPSAGGWSSNDTYPREVADVNGGGMADIVGFSSAGVFESLATGGGAFAAPTFELAAFGVDAGGWSSNDTYPRTLADVNGDGMADIIGFSSVGVFESLATAGGHFATPTFELGAFGTNAGGWSSNDTYPRALADVNGDTRADIIGFSSVGVFESLATGNGDFMAPTFELAAFGTNAGNWSSDNTYPRALADVNGDHMADIVGFGADGVYVSLATGGGNFAAPTFELAAFGASAGAGGWTSQDLYPRTLADVNGDGMADIVGFGADVVSVSLSTGGGHFASPTFQLLPFGPSIGGWSSDTTYPRQLADINGNGTADIIGFASNGVMTSPH
jgi:uncharacterized repeat protein (TIGR01451 family)